MKWELSSSSWLASVQLWGWAAREPGWGRSGTDKGIARGAAIGAAVKKKQLGKLSKAERRIMKGWISDYTTPREMRDSYLVLGRAKAKQAKAAEGSAAAVVEGI